MKLISIARAITPKAQIHVRFPTAGSQPGTKTVSLRSTNQMDLMEKNKQPNLPAIGWREWVGLPDLDVKAIKAKVDTGARSSSLHAFDIEEFTRDDESWLRFKIHPDQRTSKRTIETEAKVLEHRSVRSSSGKASLRPVILTKVKLLDVVWAVELTLANRDEMGFRMLLGREAFRRRFVVDAGNSYYGGRPKLNKKRSGS